MAPEQKPLPADSLLSLPLVMLYPDLEFSSLSSIAALDSWLCREGAPRRELRRCN